jgi:hypothetical protein
MLRKHAGFAPARQSLLGFRLRSPLPLVEEPCPLSLQTAFEAFSLRLVKMLFKNECRLFINFASDIFRKLEIIQA